MQEIPVCLIPGPGRSAGEEIGYPLRYSWVSLVAQVVKNPPAMWETWVRYLGWEDPLEKEKATHSSILAWRIPGTAVRGVAKTLRRLRNFHFHFCFQCYAVIFKGVYKQVLLLYLLSLEKQQKDLSKTNIFPTDNTCRLICGSFFYFSASLAPELWSNNKV